MTEAPESHRSIFISAKQNIFLHIRLKTDDNISKNLLEHSKFFYTADDAGDDVDAVAAPA